MALSLFSSSAGTYHVAKTMNQEKNIMKGMLAIIVSFLIIATPLAAQEHPETLQQIRKNGKIRIGYRLSEPPMSFVDKNDNPSGYSIDLCKGIVAEVEQLIGAKVNVEYVPVTAQGRFKALRDNKIDILCGSTTKTISRCKLVDFTQLTFVTGASLMTLRDDTSIDSEGLSGKKIGVVKATTTAAALNKLIRETSTDAEIVLYNTAQESVDALRKKEIHAFSSDQVVLIGIVSKAPDSINFVVRSEVFSFEPFALAVRRNDADFRLVADRAISDLCRSKKILEIYDKWIGRYTRQRLPLFDAMIKLNAIPK